MTLKMALKLKEIDHYFVSIGHWRRPAPDNIFRKLKKNKSDISRSPNSGVIIARFKNIRR